MTQNVNSTTQTPAEVDEQSLRKFDFNTRYGPRCGLTRRERYNRAKKFGLDPPQSIIDALNRRPEERYNNATGMIEKVSASISQQLRPTITES